MVLGLVFLTHANSDLINHAASSNKPLVRTKKKGGIAVTGSAPHQRCCGAGPEVYTDTTPYVYKALFVIISGTTFL